MGRGWTANHLMGRKVKMSHCEISLNVVYWANCAQSIRYFNTIIFCHHTYIE